MRFFLTQFYFFVLLFTLTPAWAARDCSGLLAGPRVRNFIKSTKSSYNLIIYELNRAGQAKFISLEATTRNDDRALDLRFIESDGEIRAHELGAAAAESAQELFANDFYRRAWLLAAALRDGEDFERVEFAWDSDALSWLDFQDHQRNPQGKWMSKFMARRGFFREEVFDVNILPESRARDGSLIRAKLALAREWDLHARSVYIRPPRATTAD